jgi:hypothetical protein
MSKLRKEQALQFLAPSKEAQRLAALHKLDILDSKPEGAMERALLGR